MAIPGNLLTANAEDVETSIAGWATDGSTTLTRTTAQFNTGTASASLVKTATAGGFVFMWDSGFDTPAVVGRTYQAYFYARSSVALQAFSRLVWYTSGLVQIGSPADGPGIGLSTTGWTFVSNTAVAPATAAFCGVQVIGGGGTMATGDTIFCDTLFFGPWLPPKAYNPNRGAIIRSTIR